MQAFMIVFFAIQILGFISSWIFWKQMQWINERYNEYRRAQGLEHKDMMLSSSIPFYVSFLFMFWMNFVVFQYYRYVRDRQLVIEQCRQRLPIYRQPLKA
ncbi:unnamed protein product, partial [Mesorhabditis spiculigera]